MNKKTATRSALFTSFISLLLCVSMLVGTTFAWFTDSVTSGKNVIAAGNLDIELYYGKEKDPATNKVTESTVDLFTDENGKEILWEPGAVAYTNLKVANEGSLALKYALMINYTGENSVNGYKLSQILKVAFVPGGVTGDRAAVIAEGGKAGWGAMANYVHSSGLEPKGATKDAEVFGLVIYWEPSAEDNNWNVQNGKQVSDYATTNVNQLHVDLGIKLEATQLVYENDSFGPTYDQGAAWTGSANNDWYFKDPDAAEFSIGTAEELAGLSALVNGTATAPISTFAATAPATVQDSFKGKTVKLTANIDLNDISWTPIGDNAHPFLGIFDGQGHTVSNLYVSNLGWAGLIGHAGKDNASTIKNVTIDGATIFSSRMAGAVVGQLYGNIENCHVKDANIMVVPNAVDGGYDNGDKVGGIVGWLGDNNNKHHITGCTVTGSTLGAYRDVGGIVGYVAWSTTVSGNKVTETSVTVDQTTNYYGEKDPNAGEIWGRNSVSGSGTGIIESNNTFENVTIDATYNKNGLTLKSDGKTVTLYLVPASFDKKTVEVPAGVTAIGSYAFAYNANIETINLPSTVTTLNNRAFRDTSASKVVLNEGLENISYQAFRNATNVKSVEIPSTVTTISLEAFQYSGVETLTIPANVKTIEYGGMRDMKQLKSVVIEGNVDIPVYAFRACTNLKTVILKGDDVTFGGGSRGMIFTNLESGDGTAITVVVANETVKERLLAADTAAKDYGGYKIVVGGTVASDAGSLADAISSGEKKILLTDNISCDAGILLPEGVTLDGNGKTITYSVADAYHLLKLSTGAAVKNVTLENYRVRTEESTNGTVTLENVVINMDNDLTGLDISRGAGTAKLTNVTCKGITDAVHLDPATQVQVDYTPYGDVLLGTKWGLEAEGCAFGSLHGWNTTNGSNVSLTNCTATVFRMHYWNNRTLYIDGVEKAWSESGAIPVAHDVGGYCWSVQPAFK